MYIEKNKCDIADEISIMKFLDYITKNWVLLNATTI